MSDKLKTENKGFKINIALSTISLPADLYLLCYCQVILDTRSMTENHGETYGQVTSVLVYKSATISDLQWYSPIGFML